MTPALHARYGLSTGVSQTWKQELRSASRRWLAACDGFGGPLNSTVAAGAGLRVCSLLSLDLSAEPPSINQVTTSSARGGPRSRVTGHSRPAPLENCDLRRAGSCHQPRRRRASSQRPDLRRQRGDCAVCSILSTTTATSRCTLRRRCFNRAAALPWEHRRCTRIRSSANAFWPYWKSGEADGRQS
jgi:hypothetical protein